MVELNGKGGQPMSHGEVLDLILEIVKEIQADVKAQGRTVAVLKWAVFGGGPLIGGAVWYLIAMHMR